ncbi:uncharacterized protein KD926_005406 [Aspergillus affinis]|uniref:uncharacterized protein n=1 Tax=Aspergillus affinis TaxID=1070780 RepID=UPI0022FDFBBB|nr:uncharacterized protein KD926_005406 [Aspergillus affinis]KAI9042551.1 hypothetical protein KD926_005406 [Aspergillus affinis]
MDPEDEKAAKRAERLRQLQMEDLGSARREYISTADIKRRNNVSLQFLEAGRMSNVQGSDAYRKAEANKEQLSAWANVHKGIGDTEDLENLDSLLDGQSHRFQLNAAIRGSNVPSYTQGADRSNFASKAVPKPSMHAGNHTSVGTSKRYSLRSASVSAISKNSEASSRQPTLSRKPSVNLLRGASNENQKHNVNKGGTLSYEVVKGIKAEYILSTISAFKKPPPVSLRTRRPAPEFAVEMSSPAAFLAARDAAKRSLENPKPSQSLFVADEIVSNNGSGDNSPLSTKQPPQKKLRTSSGLSESTHQPADDKKSRQDLSSELFEKYVLPGMTTQSNQKAHEAPHDSKAPTSQKPSTSLSDSIHKTNDATMHPRQPSGMVLKHPTTELATSLTRSTHSPKDDSAADSHAPSNLPANHPQNRSATSSVRSSGIFKDEKTANPKGSHESAARSLVTVRLPSSNYSVHGRQDDKAHSTPISERVINPEPQITPRPSKPVQTSVPKIKFEMSSEGSTKPLKEISNAKSAQDKHGILLDVNATPTKSSAQNGNENDPLMSPSFQDLEGLDFAQQVQTPKQEPTQPTPARRIDFHAVSAMAKGNESSRSEDMEMLCKLLKSTSISDKQKENLQECKDELQSKLLNDPQTPTPPRFGTQGSQVPNQSTDSTPTGNRPSALSPPSRLSVKAAAFVPQSFKDHRSPTRTISSGSSQFAVPVEKEQPTIQPAVKPSLIGNWNMLPGSQGRRERMEVTARMKDDDPSPRQLPLLSIDIVKSEVQSRKRSHRALTDASEGSSRSPIWPSASKTETPFPPVTDSIFFRRRAPSKPVRMTDPN